MLTRFFQKSKISSWSSGCLSHMHVWIWYFYSVYKGNLSYNFMKNEIEKKKKIENTLNVAWVILMWRHWLVLINAVFKNAWGLYCLWEVTRCSQKVFAKPNYFFVSLSQHGLASLKITNIVTLNDKLQK